MSVPPGLRKEGPTGSVLKTPTNCRSGSSIRSRRTRPSTILAKVLNISQRGCHLWFISPEDGKRVKLKEELVATLDVEDFAIPMKVEVVRLIGESEAAVRFKPPFPRELEKLNKFLEPRCLGLSMREIDPSKLKKESQLELRWFQGVNDTSLFSWFNVEAGKIVQQQLVFLEKVVEWREGSEVKTGRIRPDTPSLVSGPGWVKSELMDFDSEPQVPLLNLSTLVLASARIDDKVKEAFLNKVKK